jgi:hypothetical protein
MKFFDSDKKFFEFVSESFAWDLSNPAQEFKGFRLEDGLIFGRFSKEDIWNLLEETNVLTKLKERGYEDFFLETHFISFLDNRIFIKTKDNQVLIHIRLKLDDFEISKIHQSLRMIYIDWLLTQNVKMGKILGKKKLFSGQEYPGLNIFKEITRFILKISREVGAHGIFNVPEYFHDAVLFHSKFKFLDPKKEAIFLNLISTFKNYNLHLLSELIHTNRIFDEVEQKVYIWKHGEMFFTELVDIENMIFDRGYFEKLENYKNTNKFRILGII